MNGTCRFTIFIYINKLPQKYIHQYAKIVGIKVLRRAFGSEKKVQYFEYEELHAQILSCTIYDTGSQSVISPEDNSLRTGSIEHEDHILPKSFTGTQSPHEYMQHSICCFGCFSVGLAWRKLCIGTLA